MAAKKKDVEGEWVPSGPKTLAQRKKERAALMQKKSGKGKMPPLIRRADQVSSTYHLRRPTGITQLDIDLGGGFPAGGLSCLSGVDNAGKSTLLYLTCAMHQRIYGDASMIALSLVEGNPDFDYMRKLGFMLAYPDDLIEQREEDRLRRGLPKFTKEEKAWFKTQVGEVDWILGATGEQIMGTMHDAIRLNIYGIIGLDSVSALQSAAEAKKPDFEKAPQQAANANLLTRFMLKYYPCMNGVFGKNQTTVIFTQQVRANKERSNALPHLQKFLPDVIAQGANALKHGKLIDVTLMKGSKDTEEDENEDGKKIRTALGRTVRYKLLKGKAGTHDEIAGEYDFSYDKGFETERTVFVQGVRYGAIEERKGVLTVNRHGLEEPLMKDIPGIEAFVKMMRDNVDFELAVRREVMAFAGKEVIYRE